MTNHQYNSRLADRLRHSKPRAFVRAEQKAEDDEWTVLQACVRNHVQTLLLASKHCCPVNAYELLKTVAAQVEEHIQVSVEMTATLEKEV